MLLCIPASQQLNPHLKARVIETVMMAVIMACLFTCLVNYFVKSRSVIKVQLLERLFERKAVTTLEKKKISF